MTFSETSFQIGSNYGPHVTFLSITFSYMSLVKFLLFEINDGPDETFVSYVSYTNLMMGQM